MNNEHRKGELIVLTMKAAIENESKNVIFDSGDPESDRKRHGKNTPPSKEEGRPSSPVKAKTTSSGDAISMTVEETK